MAKIASAVCRSGRAQRQDRLAALQGLNLALLVHAQDERVLRRADVQPDDIAHLVHKLGIGRELNGFSAVRLQPESAPDPEMLSLDKPAGWPMNRVLHWVACAGLLSNVIRITSATFSSLMVRGAPGRGK